MRRLGFVGLGLMGSGICSHFVEQGLALAVYDADEEKRVQFGGKAIACKSAAEVIRNSDIVFLSLPNSNIVETVVGELLEEGVAGKVIIDLSTSYPLSTKKLFGQVKERGGTMIDSPLLAGPDEARCGQLQAVVSGEKEAVEGLDDVFRAYCKEYTYVGEIGNAHTMKIMMNFTGLMYALILGQMFPMAEKLGLDPKKLYETMDNDIFSNWMYRFYAPKMIDRSFDMAFGLGLGLKDLTYMKKLYEEYNVPAFALDGALDLLRISMKDGKGKQDFSRCAETMYEFLGL